MNKLILFIGLLVMLFLVTSNKEKYGQGALTQLFAKGPQDTYLTGDAWKYIPWWYYGNHGPYGRHGVYRRYGLYPRYGYGRYWPWHIPTRTRYGYWY